MPIATYLSEYERVRLEGAPGPAWLARLRDEAAGRFQALGFPTTKQEEWRFTSVAPIAGTACRLAGHGEGLPAGVDPFRLTGPLAAELVFVDGRYAPALSRVGPLPSGARVGSLRAALRNGAHDVEAHLARLAPVQDQPFTALNTAFLEDGAFVHIPAHARLADPVHLLFIATGGNGDGPAMTHPRVLVVMGDDSQAAVIESYGGIAANSRPHIPPPTSRTAKPEARSGDRESESGDRGSEAWALRPDQPRVRYFTNAVTEAVLGEHAVFDHVKMQRESLDGCHVASMHLLARRGAAASSHSLTFGGALVRNDVVAVLDGEGAGCTLNGLYVADGTRLVDNHTTIDHARPHCGSRETYKGILSDRARAVFNGRIVVRPDAQKTDAKQTNRALLLSEDARINTTPQLQIFANDVKCTHGATVGQLDEEALFYLRSRGLGAPDAQRMLIRAFAGDILDRMPIASARHGAAQVLARELGT